MNPSRPALQRATALRPLGPLLAEGGIALDDVLAGTGVAAEDLQPDRFIPYAAVATILERAATLTGREDFGLELGLRQGLVALGPVGEVMRRAATLGEALADFAAFQIANSTGATVYLHGTANEIFLGYGIYDGAGAASPQLHDAVVAIGATLVAALTGGAIRPTEIATVRPLPADPAPWRRLGAPVGFGQEQTGLYLGRAAAATPLPGADRAARDAALAALAPALALAPWGWAGRTRHAMRSLLLEGRSAMPEVAAHLDIHPRSLHRALAREGSGFEAIRDDVRLAVARELLALTPLPVGSLALTLDYASPSAFIHAFRRWTGSSPAAWRAAQQPAAGRAEHAGADRHQPEAP